MDNNSSIKNKSIEKAVKVLNCFTRKPQLGVTEISDRLGMTKSNVHNILTTLRAMNYIEKDEETDKYRLGIGIFALSRALGDSFFITKIAMPYLQELANITNERVYLGVGYEDEILYLEAFYPAESLNLMRSLLGERAKMYATGIGKAILAFLPEEKINEYIERNLTPFTKYTITDKELLLKELNLTKLRGYAIDNMEHEFGIKCVGVPIFDKTGEVFAAISVSGPSLRFDDNRIEELGELVQSYARKIEKRIL